MDNCEAKIILTGLYWWRHSSNTSDVRLITTYRHHGIQYGVLLYWNCLNSNGIHARLWDIGTMTVVQSINMHSPM